MAFYRQLKALAKIQTLNFLVCSMEHGICGKTNLLAKVS